MVRRAHRGVHRRRRPGGRGRIVGTVLLVLAVAGGITLFALTREARQPADPVPVRAETAVAAAAVAAVAECSMSVALGRDAVEAARSSYSNWAGHVRAQIDLDAGTITREQAWARWTDTMATGDADIAEFRAARDIFDAQRDGCAQRPEWASADGDPMLVDCRSEFDAVSTAVAAAGGVVDEWAQHLEMMKAEEQVDPAQYGQRWRAMVESAPTVLDGLSQTSLELTQHANCPRP
jgi:hypothetical protein